MAKSKKREGIGLAIAGIVVPAVMGLGAAIYVTERTDSPPVDCGAQVEVYTNQASEHPTIDFKLPSDSEVEKQCAINKILDDMRGGEAEILP